MSIIHDIAEALQDILTTGANTAAKESGFVQRKSTLDGPAFVQTLVFGFLANPDATGQELEQTAIDRGIEVTESAIVQRYSATSAEFMRLIVQQAIERVITTDPAMIPLLNRFSHVIIQDSTTVGLPNELAEIWAGCGSSTKAGSAALKCQLAWDLCTGQLHGIELQNGRDSEIVPVKSARTPSGRGPCISLIWATSSWRTSKKSGSRTRLGLRGYRPDWLSTMRMANGGMT